MTEVLTHAREQGAAETRSFFRFVLLLVFRTYSNPFFMTYLMFFPARYPWSIRQTQLLIVPSHRTNFLVPSYSAKLLVPSIKSIVCMFTN